MTADGSVIIDARIDTREFNKGTANMQRSIERLGGAVKKLGTLIAATFVVRKLFQFGKEAVELGSDLQEVQNVVDSVFTTMSDKVDEFAINAARTAGLSETMAKRYVGTFGAMAKSFGFTEGAALDMSTTLAQLSGDVASFYNISQDAAYTKLKSVFTGETESLKELGVVMTQTALDQYALANGFGKTTSNMSEQEKVALRYQFVLNQLSTASGDFIRTSDGWANQVRILKLQIESLKASIGQGLINILTPVIKVINTLLAKLATLANAFKSFTELITGKKSSGSTGAAAAGLTDNSDISSLGNEYSSASAGAQRLADSTKNAADATKEAAKAANKYLSPLDQINKYSKENTSQTSNQPSATGGSYTGSTPAGRSLSVDYGQVAQGSTVIDEVDNKFQKLFETLKAYIQPLSIQIQRFAGIAKDAFGWLLENVLKPLANFTINEAVPRFFQTLANVMEILNEILIALQPLWQWFWDNVLQPIISFTADLFLKAWDAINDALKKFADWCSQNPKVIETITIIIGSFFAAFLIVGLIEKIMGIVNSLASFIGTIKTLSSVMGAGSLASGMLGKAISALSSPAGIAVLAIGGIIAVGVLLWKNWDTIKAKASEIWGKIKDWLGRTWENIKRNASQFAQKLKDVFLKCWNGIKTAASTVWNGIKTTLSNIWNGIKGVASTVFGAVKDTVGKAWNGIKDISSNIWGGIKNVVTGALNAISSKSVDVGNIVSNALKNGFQQALKFIKTPINGIIGLINSLIKGITSGINLALSALNHIRVDIPSWVPVVGGKKFGFNFSMLTAPKIPYLAKGAVIPPNAPFMAVLGDQKNGTNIETPEALLRKIIREETGNRKTEGNSKYQFTAQINRRTLFDEIITEAMLRQSSSGRNPFELA